MTAPLTPEQLAEIRERAESKSYPLTAPQQIDELRQVRKDRQTLLADRELLTARIEELERENARLDEKVDDLEFKLRYGDYDDD